MSAGMLTTIRFAAAVAVLLTALVGALWVFDVAEGAAVRDALEKTLAVVVLFALASLAVVALSRPRRSS